MNRRALKIKLEAIRQARRIHGGVWQHCIAILGIKLVRVPVPTKRSASAFIETCTARSIPPALTKTKRNGRFHLTVP